MDGTEIQPQVLEQNWPVFSCGGYAQDSSVRTQVVQYRCQIEIGQVTVQDGDIVFGDIDGVVIIPKEIAEEVITKALEKAAGEKQVRKAIENGMSATEAFSTFGIPLSFNEKRFNIRGALYEQPRGNG